MALLSVVLATGNPGKAREFGRLLGESLHVQAMPSSVGLPEEDGATFAANARLKAETVLAALEARMAVLADDSGLEVAALGGSPGVRSARFAGDHASDEENVARLLRELSDREDREARFVCSLCLALPGSFLLGDRSGMAADAGAATFVEVEGASYGVITSAPRGNDGFGYDPVFQPDGWSWTLAEALPQDKDRVSHRGAAARALLAALADRGLAGYGS